MRDDSEGDIDMTDVNVVGATSTGQKCEKPGIIPWPSSQPEDSKIKKELEKRELSKLRDEWLDE